MRRSTIGVGPSKWIVVAAAGLVLTAGGLRLGYAQQGATSTLTVQDRAEIQDVLNTYGRYFDYADVDAHEWVKRVWTPDGMFVNLTSPPAAGECPVVKADAPIGQWKTASHDLIKGTLPDKLGIKVCVEEVHGYVELAWRATNIHKVRGTVWRTMYRPAYIEAIPGGARATVAAQQFAWDPSGGKWAGGGTYIEDMVKTPGGWRIKKRVWIPDAVVGKWRPAGAPPVTGR